VGPTGAGKSKLARRIFELKRMRHTITGEFLDVNCATLRGDGAMSTLFGHVKGAFTGANQDKVGVFEYANGGTAMLDEIGEMPLAMQAKLLRVLQNHEVQRVGSPAVTKVDVRVVAATHRDLQEMAKQGRFREDLYFRLSAVELKVPSLAERAEDLPLLERHFLKAFAAQYHKPISGLTRRAQTVLARYAWPGNIRELQNVIEHASMMTESDVIDVRDLPERVQNQSADTGSAHEVLMSIDQLERRHAQRVLDHVGGNKVRAAEILGISRTHLYQLLKDPAEKHKEKETVPKSEE
jgi:two-component system, NtrC family, response regulator HydG